jgi:hypothetical protein
MGPKRCMGVNQIEEEKRCISREGTTCANEQGLEREWSPVGATNHDGRK